MVIGQVGASVPQQIQRQSHQISFTTDSRGDDFTAASFVHLRSVRGAHRRSPKAGRHPFRSVHKAEPSMFRRPAYVGVSYTLSGFARDTCANLHVRVVIAM